MLKLIIADDDKVIRNRLVSIIDWNSIGYTVIGEASDGKELLEKTIELRPDVVITDIKMPLLDGIDYVKKIKEYRVESEIVVISAYAEFEYAQKLLYLGVYAYILKPIEKDELKNCMSKLHIKIMGRSKKEAFFHQVTDDIKKEIVELFQQFETEQLLMKIETIHANMLRCNLSMNEMYQNYTYIFNCVYRGIQENWRSDAIIKNLMLTLFDDFIELNEEKIILEYVLELMRRLIERLKYLEAEDENIYWRRTLDYIDTHFAENLSMAEVANRVGISYGYMSSIMNKNVEGGFIHALRNRRLEEAKKLLETTDLKIYEIAERVGFANSRYFCSVFYSYVGIKASVYRKKNYRGNREQ